MTPPLLAIDRLEVAFRLRDERGLPQRHVAVHDVSLQVQPERIVALVGESGSGKSVTAMAAVGLLPPNAELQGSIRWQGQELVGASPAVLQGLRGRDIGCVFQDPMSSLNPVLTIGEQLAEPLRRHLRLSRRAARERAAELLAEVGLPEPQRRLASWPHELSGGQQQRVMIATALACGPQLLIADEPTPALDVLVQRQVLELLLRLVERRRMSVLFISHDLGVVGEVADEVVVMQDGVVREQGPVARIFEAPRHPYTRMLLACRPDADADADGDADAAAAAAAAGPDAAPGVPRPPEEIVLEAQALGRSYRTAPAAGTAVPGNAGAPAWWRAWRGVERPVLREVSFALRRGRTLGVVGGSGSGKSTLALTLLQLNEPGVGRSSGEVRLGGQRLRDIDGLSLRRRVQIVFQNPYASLNPRMTIAQTLDEPLRIHRLHGDARGRATRARVLLAEVGLDETALSKYPHEFSGGQRQRIAIARCLALEPEVLVLDEALSALDVSVQAQVLALLRALQARHGLAYLFISHDLGVVQRIADEVIVMHEGRIVEQGAAAPLLAAPQSEITRALLAAVPRGWRADRRGRLDG